MMGSTVLKQIVRWATLFVPFVFAFAFLQFCIDSGPRPEAAGSAAPGSSLASSGFTFFFRNILTDWVLVNTFNNMPSTAALSDAHGHGDSAAMIITLLGWIAIIYGAFVNARKGAL